MELSSIVCVCEAVSLGEPSLILRQREFDNIEPLTNMEGFRSSARELLHRIDLLEKRQAKVRHTVTQMTENLSAHNIVT